LNLKCLEHNPPEPSPVTSHPSENSVCSDLSLEKERTQPYLSLEKERPQPSDAQILADLETEMKENQTREKILNILEKDLEFEKK